MTNKDRLTIATWICLLVGVIWFVYAFVQEKKIKGFAEQGIAFKAIITNGRATAGTKNGRSFYLSFASLSKEHASYKGEIEVPESVFNKYQNGHEVDMFCNEKYDEKFMLKSMTENVPPLKRSVFGLILFGIGCVCLVINKFLLKKK